MNPEFFNPIDYDRLNHLQVGRIGEYWVKLVLTLKGLDTYTSEVDDKGIDFVVRLSHSRYIDIQVKTVRLKKNSYVFISKAAWQHQLRDNLYLALVLLQNDQPPAVYLIPSTAWETPGKIFCDRDYGGSRSKPEWGLNLSEKNLKALEGFLLQHMIESLRTWPEPR